MNNSLQRTGILISLVLIIAGVFAAPLLDSIALILAMALILLLGIPHGAADHLLFFSLMNEQASQNKNIKTRFYIQYLGLIAIYTLMWVMLPVIALVVFLAISVYHFGQSNLHHTVWKNSGLKTASMILSGCFVLMTPLLFHIDTARPVIESLTADGDLVKLSALQCRPVALAIACTYGLFIAAMLMTGFIESDSGKQELIRWLVLFTLFLTTPLWIGFSVYFAIWHALPSMKDQIEYFRSKKSEYGIKHYIKQVIPYSVLALLGLSVAALLPGHYFGPEGLAILFAFIAVITLPHMLLMDLLYKTGLH